MDVCGQTPKLMLTRRATRQHPHAKDGQSAPDFPAQAVCIKPAALRADKAYAALLESNAGRTGLPQPLFGRHKLFHQTHEQDWTNQCAHARSSCATRMHTHTHTHTHQYNNRCKPKPPLFVSAAAASGGRASGESAHCPRQQDRENEPRRRVPRKRAGQRPDQPAASARSLPSSKTHGPPTRHLCPRHAWQTFFDHPRWEDDFVLDGSRNALDPAELASGGPICWIGCARYSGVPAP